MLRLTGKEPHVSLRSLLVPAHPFFGRTPGPHTPGACMPSLPATVSRGETAARGWGSGGKKEKVGGERRPRERRGGEKEDEGPRGASGAGAELGYPCRRRGGGGGKEEEAAAERKRAVRCALCGPNHFGCRGPMIGRGSVGL